jgi:hypothetical protein
MPVIKLRQFWSVRRWRVLVAIFALALVAAAAPPVVERADPQRYLADVKTLAAPEMEGRGPGTKGIERAAHLIEKRFHALGLEPAGTNGYFQPFNVVTGAKLKTANRFRVISAGAKRDLTILQEYVPFSFSSSESIPASPLVFAGYGASATEFGYDDYAGVDVKDKIVVVLLHEPAGFVAKVGSSGLTRHSQLLTKAINARNHGARAIIILNGKLGDGEEDALTQFGSVSGPTDAGIAMVQVKNDIAQSWFQSAGKSLAETQFQIDQSTNPASFSFPDTLRASLNVNIETTHAKVENVLGYLPGKSAEYVIVGAHYDHLGRGNFDSLAPSQIGQIHPGADDNASGTAGVLELARLLAPQKGHLARGVLFMSFSGEELGLLGSAEWVKHPTRPLDKAVAMVNMDMIGRIKDAKIYIGGVGTGSTFKSILDSTPGKENFKIEYSPGGYAASDHTSFVTQRIPVLFFFSGLHSDYHKPSDTWDKINAPDAAHLLDFITGVIVALADAPKRPEYIAVVEDKPSGTSGGGGGYGPYFGSIPDFGQTENGVRFSDVKPGSPAAKAGLKGGDVLIQFGGKPIKNLYDFTDALRASKVGDVVEVTVVRDGQPLKASVKLEPRR